MKRLLTSAFGIAFAGLLSFVAASPAWALTVSPPTFEYNSLNPGDATLDVIKIFNELSQPVTVYPQVANFTSDKNEGGNPTFYPANTDPYGTALAPWISVNTPSITLNPNERGTLSFTINVPKDHVQPGGHYGAIILSTSPPGKEGNSVGVSSQIGVLILVNVSGQVREVGTISEFGFKNPKAWYDHLPVNFFLRFENSGNTHVHPAGNLVITNMIGQKVATIPINPDFRSVLPSSIRRLEFGWQKGGISSGDSELKQEWTNFAFGKYTARLLLTYGTHSQMLTDERTFYVWPIRVTAIIVIGLLILLFVIYKAVRAYNESVISRYERGRPK